MTSGSGPLSKHRPILQPSTLGKYIGLDTCARYFKFHIEDAGFEDLRHDKEDFIEAFRGGNIIEKKAGNEFEADVIDVIKQHVTDFYDVEQTTLAMAAQTVPETVVEILNDITLDDVPSAEQLTIADIENGDFTYADKHANDIVLSDPDTLTATVTDTDDDPTSGTEDEPDSGMETPFDQDSLHSAFFQIRVAYTETLLDTLIRGVNDRPADTDLDFPAPAEDTGRDAPATSDTRPANDPVVVFQPSFTADIGAWTIAGDADIILIWPGDTTDTNPADATAKVRVIDVKLAAEEQANHQIQTVTYSMAIAQLNALADIPLDLETGVLTQHDTYLPLTPTVAPEFDRASRETDLKRLTKPGGVLDTVLGMQFDDAPFQLDSKCSSCQYNEVCYTTAIENAGLELLGVNRGLQRTLEKHGVKDLNDLAALADSPGEEPHPKKDSKPPAIRPKEDTYNALATIPGLGEKLPELIQRAQGLLNQLNPDHRRVEGVSNAVHITNTGYGNLPDDNWNENWEWGNYENYRSGSMIRVYLNVQYDHVRDVLAGMAFHVTAAASVSDPVSFGILDRDMPENPVDAHRAEVEMLEKFIEELFGAIESVGRGIFLDGYEQDNPFLHFFTYTEEEKRLMEERLALYTAGNITVPSTWTPNAVQHTTSTSGTGRSATRTSGDGPARQDGGQQTLIESLAATPHAEHGDKADDGEEYEHEPVTKEIEVSDNIKRFRELLGRRKGADQQMISAVAPDVDARMALQTPTNGLVNVFDQFWPRYRTDEVFKVTDWKYTPSDPDRLPDGETEIDLKQVFNYRLFNNRARFVQDTDSIRLLLADDASESPDGWYESRVRNGAQIPLAYLWAASKKITDEWVEEAQESEADFIINPYRYHDGEAKDTKITDEDVESMMKRMCECLRHIEQGIPEKSLIRVPDEGSSTGENDDEPKDGEIA